MFEHSLIDLEAKPQPRRRWISLPIAVGLHVVGLTAFAFASYWSVGAVPEPKTNIVFVSLAPMPELSDGGGGQRPVKPLRTPQEVTPPTPDKPVQPTDETVPDKLPAATTTPPVSFDDSAQDATDSLDFGDGPNLGIGFGKGNGPGIGDGHGDGDGPGIGVGESEPIRITVGMTKPVTIHQVQPRYTELARRSGIQGTVVVEAVIDEQGYVTNVRVLRGLPMGLDRAAMEAIQQWRFKPATLADKPVKVYFTLTVNFTIQR